MSPGVREAAKNRYLETKKSTSGYIDKKHRNYARSKTKCKLSGQGTSRYKQELVLIRASGNVRALGKGIKHNYKNCFWRFSVD